MLEDETTEFKAEYSDGIVKSAVAFLNTRGGVIYVGIADDGTVCGVDDPDGLTRKIVQELTDNIRPDVMRFMRAGPEEIDGKAVVKIVVMANKYLGMVREFQQNTYHGRYCAVDLSGSPDLSKIAEAYKVRFLRLSDPDKMQETIDEFLRDDDSVLMECVINPMDTVK